MDSRLLVTVWLHGKDTEERSLPEFIPLKNGTLMTTKLCASVVNTQNFAPEILPLLLPHCHNKAYIFYARTYSR